MSVQELQTVSIVVTGSRTLQMHEIEFLEQLNNLPWKVKDKRSLRQLFVSNLLDMLFGEFTLIVRKHFFAYPLLQFLQFKQQLSVLVARVQNHHLQQHRFISARTVGRITYLCISRGLLQL